MNAKYLLGCAIFIDVLTPCSIFSKLMQSDSLDIVGTLSRLIRTVKETNKRKSKPLSQWATYSATLKKFTQREVNIEEVAELYTRDLPSPELLDQEVDRWKRKFGAMEPEFRPTSCASAIKVVDPMTSKLVILLKIACTACD